MTHTTQMKIKEIPLNITEGAMANFEVMKFNVLKSYFPHLNSKREFLTSNKYLGNITIQFESPHEKLRAKDLYDGVLKVLQDVSRHIQKIETEYEGTNEFYPERVHDVLRDKKVYYSNPQGDGQGISQAMVVGENQADLAFESWYAYDDNYGTDEEKAFVKYFQGLVPDLKKEYDEIYLVRNERIPALAIYEFDTGERFEPDFLLFLQNMEQKVIFKSRFILSLKEAIYFKKINGKDFLLRLKNKGYQLRNVDDNEYRIFGLPFFNKELRMEEFATSFNRIGGCKND